MQLEDITHGLLAKCRIFFPLPLRLSGPLVDGILIYNTEIKFDIH